MTTTEKTYSYVDERGEELLQVIRKDLPDGKKKFLQRRWNPHAKDWVWGLGEKQGDGWTLPEARRVPYRLPEVLAGYEVYLVEGEKCADILAEKGITATCILGGSSGWKQQYDYAQYFKGKSVIILPDNDEPGRGFAKRAYADLKAVAADVSVVELPGLGEKEDVYDWLTKHGHDVDDLHIQSAVQMTEDPEPPKADPRKAPTRSEDDGQLKPNQIGRLLMLENRMLADPSGNTFIYRDNYFQPLSLSEIKAMALELDEPIDKSTDKRRNEVAHFVRAATFEREIPWGNVAPYEIPVKNGVLDLRTSTLRPHREDDYLETIIPWEFDPAAKCPTWERYLGTCFGDDEDGAAKIAALQEFAGYLPMPRAHLKKAFILYGPPDTGKSIAVKVLSWLVGERNVTSIRLQDMGDPRKLAEIRGKLLNAIPEVSSGVRLNDGGFKRLVSGGDSVLIDAKYQAPQYIVPIAKHLIAGNNLPDVEDESEATHKRFVIIGFNRVIPESEQDRELDAKILAEMPGVLAWAAHGAARLLENGGNFTEVESSKTAVAKHRDDLNPVVHFIEEEMTAADDPDEYVKLSEFNERFRRWYGRSVGPKAIAHWRRQAGLRDGHRLGVRAVLGYHWPDAML